MKKIGFILFFFVTIGICQAQQDTLQVRLRSSEQKVMPNNYFTLMYEVKSNTKMLDSVIANLAIPENWKILSKRNPFIIKGQDILKYTFTIYVPGQAISKNYNIKFVLNDLSQKTLIEKSDSIFILKNRKIEITLLKKPDFAKEADTLVTEFLVNNIGNTDEAVQVSSIGEGKIDIGKDTIVLKRNTSKLIKNTYYLTNATDNVNNFNFGISINLKDSIKAIIKTENIPFYSSKLKKNDPYLRLPIKVGLWYSVFSINNKLLHGPQFDITTNGYLDFAKKHHIDLRLHGPNRINVPIVGNIDQYSLIYSYQRRTTFTVGDYNLQFNNLIEFSRFGRGIRYDQDFKRTGFSVLFISPRFYDIQKESFGGRFYLNTSKNHQVSLNYYNKRTQYNSGLLTSNFLGLTSEYKTQNTYFNTEFTAGKITNKYDIGFFNRVSFNQKRFRLNNDIIYTGKNFTGFYTNSKLFILSLGYDFTKKLGVNVIGSYTDINPSFDILTPTVPPFTINNAAFITYKILKNTQVNFGYNRRQSEDKATIKRFRYIDEFAQLGLNITYPKFILSMDGRYGNSINLLAPATDSTSKRRSLYQLVQPEIKITRWLWLGGYFQYQQNNKFTKTNSLVNYYFYGGSIRMTYKDKINLSFLYRNNFAPDELVEQRTLLNINLNARFKNHQIDISGGRFYSPVISTSNFNTNYLTLKYSFTINAPVSKNKNLSSISGEIIGLDKTIKRAGIKVKVGEKQFITDSSGKFYFTKLVPNRYVLNIDPTDVGFGVIPTVKTPILITTKPDSTMKIKIELTKTGSLEGEVKFINNNKAGTENIEVNKPIVLVKLFNDNESFITQVNEKNKFLFKELKPNNNWNLKVWVPMKENEYTIKQTDQQVKISPDSLSLTSVSIVPNERKIYFSQNNFNLISKKEEPKKAEKKKEEIKVEPISKLKTKADSLNATSDTKKLKQDEAKKPIKTVQNNFPKKTFDKVSVRPLRRKTRVVIQAPKRNVWKGFDGRIVWNSPNQSSEQNTFSPNTSSNDNTATDTSELTDTEPNRNLKNKERQRR